MNPTLRLLGAAAAIASTTCACIPHAATRASRTATPVVIDETLKSLEDPRTGERIAAIVDSPEMQKAMGDLAASFVGGILDDPATTARIERLTVALTKTVAEAIHEEVAKLAPEIRVAVRQTVTEMVAAATRQATLTLAEDVPRHLAPALRASVATQLQQPDIRGALEDTSRDVARQVVTASHEAIMQGQLDNPGVLYRTSRLIRVATWALLFAILAGATVLVVWVRKVRRQARETASINTSRRARAAPRSRRGSSRLRSSRW